MTEELTLECSVCFNFLSPVPKELHGGVVMVEPCRKCLEAEYKKGFNAGVDSMIVNVEIVPNPSPSAGGTELK